MEQPPGQPRERAAGMTRREKRRLQELLARWAGHDDPPLDGRDRDAIARLRFLLATDLDGDPRPPRVRTDPGGRAHMDCGFPDCLVGPDADCPIVGRRDPA